MSFIKISKIEKTISGTLNLVSSKSESNRVLIIEKILNNSLTKIANLSESDDTKLIQKLLASNNNELNPNNAGTVMRFLTAFFATQQGEEKILTGSERMQQRPIKELVEALIKIGADITYLKNDGYPPIKIKGKKLSGGELSIKGNVSSQFITALLLISPLLENGLVINIEGKIASKPYIEMTLSLMNHFGIGSSFENSKIIIKKQSYLPNQYVVETDWSSVSYWYAFAAFSESCNLKLLGLKKESFQGDSVIAKIMENFGVLTNFDNEGVTITKSDRVCDYFEFDFSDCPDIAQTIAVICYGLKVKAKLTGLESLKIKETDRIEALAIELSKIGALIEKTNSSLEIKAFNHVENFDNVIFESYDDHRMVLAFATLSILNPVNINNYECISKSYPNFINNLLQMNFNVKEC